MTQAATRTNQGESGTAAAGQVQPNATPAGDADQVVDAAVNAAIAEVSHIATLPEVTLKIIRLVEDPDSSAQDLHKVINNDPALGARIVKVVNSAFYGLPGQIGSINRAIVLLGLNAVKNIAIAASLAKLFRGGQISPNFNARDLWTHSIAVAATTSLLSDKVGLGLKDEAFLAGLIHDIGLMVEMQARRVQFVEVLDKLDADPSAAMRQVEREVIGADHEAFGAALCRHWKFPESFCYVTGYHHHPWDIAPANRTLASLVHLADLAVARAGVGFSRTAERADHAAATMEELGLSADDVADVCKMLPDAIAEARTLFGGEL